MESVILETLPALFIWKQSSSRSLFPVCNHRQVTNVSGCLCRWRTRPGTTARRRPAATRRPTPPTPHRPIAHSIITRRMIAAGVSGNASSAVFCPHLLSLRLLHFVFAHLLSPSICFSDTNAKQGESME